ncbi:MAG: Dam family site-specific DNA-(adenine-N6)-methyltransferase [Proteobacteria bacterium]|nr:Dam family site-specific DNA-(adenine-N6)-methyltransferase [Pseudomonadota bacterium]
MGETTLIRPFLKWPGGKYRLLPVLQEFLPPRNCLVEPFAGAGALFINSMHREVIVNDINPDLINLFRLLQTQGDDFIIDAKKLFVHKNNHKQSYYRLRERFNSIQTPWERALLFLYLNRHGYNGLCRYNAKGIYNVPFGDYVKPYFPLDELHYFKQRAKQVTFHCQDFVDFLTPFLKYPKRKMQQITFYCDPPYAPLSATANFTGYAQQHFSLNHQQQLADLAHALAKKGATVLISNHNTPFTREIYRHAICTLLEVRRSISCKTKARNKVSELIACFSAS